MQGARKFDFDEAIGAATLKRWRVKSSGSFNSFRVDEVGGDLELSPSVIMLIKEEKVHALNRTKIDRIGHKIFTGAFTLL